MRNRFILECLKCDKSYQSSSLGSKYCPDCNPSKKKMVMKAVVIRPCSLCGKEFEPKATQRGAIRAYCKECRDNRYQPRPQRLEGAVECNDCGAMHYPRRFGGWRSTEYCDKCLPKYKKRR